MSQQKIINTYGVFNTEEECEKEIEKMYENWNKEYAGILRRNKEEYIREKYKAKKVYYYEYGNYISKDGKEHCECDITTDENEAKKVDKDYRLATINEVEEFIGLGYEIIPVIETADGIYCWFEQEYIDGFDNEEYFCKYVWMQPNSELEIRNLANCIDRIKKERI